MISLVNAGKRFGPRVLFEGLNWLVTPQDRVGLVGANGTGKTTLLKMLAGIEQADLGEITKQKGLRVGYLPQDGLNLSGRTVFDECLSVFDEQREMEREIERLAHVLSDTDPASEEYAEAADRYASLDSHFRNLDGYSLEAKVGTVLTGLGFPKDDWGRRTEHFSGGWQMRIALAKLLLQQPDLLLLDEPTNHLDLEARNWLEEYLTSYPNAFVLISHDRYFLDVTVRKIAELWNRGLHFYTGNYEKYLKQKTERRELLEAAYKNQKERIEQLEAFINRFRATATKAKQVQSRIKELEKIERIEIPPDERTIHFSFPQPKASGRVVAEFRDVAKAYGEKLVLGGVNFAIERHDRVALVGVNGAGKSTLIKLLAGAEPLTRGEYALGHNAMPDYFAQDQYKELDPEARMLDDLVSVSNGKTITELRSLLGCFLFSEDDVYKPIGVLSGGERNRYALARLLLNPSNFLLLDEPTNHLDMRAKDVLLSALEEFSGTVVFVSHDRYFIDKLATRVFEIENGGVQVFPGNYEDYLYRKAGGAGVVVETEVEEAVAAAVVENGAGAGPAKRVNPIRVQKLKRRMAELEGAAAGLETEIAKLETALQNYVSAEETQRQSRLLEEKQGALAAALGEWEALGMELEEAG
ncbi:MAG TPA: ABC-F family ATP-binding cassette domain-containing protein [Bryobacteraceae bacterium]|nr:ABC transporter ATP-binding protein [Bryobacterales bacterium]HRJ18262.1 ABC-F family ATP-binding cassette domain-containing protein [Bryobacteraceae bacterium]